MSAATARPLTARQRWMVLGVGLAVAIAGGALGVVTGPGGIELPLGAPGGGGLLTAVRLPRVALALIAGAGLSTAGAALQALLRNPLADPYVIGVSGGAALGGALFIALGGALATFVEGGAMAGALGATLLLSWFLARDPGRGDATLLAGVVFNAFASALITVLKTALPAGKTQSLLFWLVGSIDYAPWSTVALVGGVVALGVAALVHQAGALELMALGPVEAERLGLDVKRARRLAYFVASVIVGAIVPVTGLIGFVGLIVPHALRLAVSADQRLLLPASALFGAGALAAVDAASRGSFLLLDTELPTGALTALIGAPFFALALARHLRPGARSA